MARILVVDDESTITMVLDQVLTDEGFQVVTAGDGGEALAIASQPPLPDLVLVDLHMPGVNGKDFIGGLHADPALKGIPVIVVTGAVPYERDYPPSGTYQALISKPFDLEDLVRQVRRVLQDSLRPEPQ